jgi:hypothetical protein
MHGYATASTMLKGHTMGDGHAIPHGMQAECLLCGRVVRVYPDHVEGNATTCPCDGPLLLDGSEDAEAG